MVKVSNRIGRAVKTLRSFTSRLSSDCGGNVVMIFALVMPALIMLTLGGIDTREVSSKTMESQKSPGLYFIGEVLDVTGHLGGFNFQWAWASGYAAAQYV